MNMREEEQGQERDGAESESGGQPKHDDEGAIKAALKAQQRRRERMIGKFHHSGSQANWLQLIALIVFLLLVLLFSGAGGKIISALYGIGNDAAPASTDKP